MNLEEQLEQMVAGSMYNDVTQELNTARRESVMLTREYNETWGNHKKFGKAFFRKYLVRLG